MQITADLLVRAMRCTRGSALTWARPLSEACAKFQITSPARIAAFLAQVGHESAGLTRTVENLNYRADGLLRTWPTRFDEVKAKALAMKPEAIANHVYGGRLGNYQPGDGYRYRGRGLIQVTGRVNYEAVQDLLRSHVDDVPDLIRMPEVLAEPKWAALSAAAYWHDHRLNELADAGDFDHITRRINGGTIGMADRQKRYEQAKQALA
jgi:putative chitinase